MDVLGALLLKCMTAIWQTNADSQWRNLLNLDITLNVTSTFYFKKKGGDGEGEM